MSAVRRRAILNYNVEAWYREDDFSSVLCETSLIGCFVKFFQCLRIIYHGIYYSIMISGFEVMSAQ